MDSTIVEIASKIRSSREKIVTQLLEGRGFLSSKDLTNLRQCSAFQALQIQGSYEEVEMISFVDLVTICNQGSESVKNAEPLNLEFPHHLFFDIYPSELK